MIKPSVLAVLIAASGGLDAQETAKTEQDPTSPWTKKLIASVNFTQASFSNWASGGENSLAWQSTIKAELTRTEAGYEFVNKGRFSFGLSRVGNTGTRKSADEIHLESVFTLKRGKYLNPFISASAQTQFASGYDYSGTTKTRISKLLDPGYFTQSAGVGYTPNKTFKTRLGATAKETVTSDFPSPYADDPDTPGIEKTRIEGGVTSTSELEHAIDEDAVFTSRLELFSNLKGFNQIDMKWENLLPLNVTKLISVNLTVDLLYDKDTTDDLQIKEILGVGLSYSFL
jgi:hypothetical protein